MCDSLLPHGLQHARLPCTSLSLGVCSNSCPLSRWCHPTISRFVVLFSSCRQSFPASGSFPVSRLFTSGGQNSGASASASVLLMNTQEWSDLRRPGWISLKSKESLLGLAISLQSQESPPTLQFQSISSSMLSFLYGPALTSICDSGKTIALTVRTFTGKLMSLLFNTLSRFVIAFPPRSTCFLYSL